MQFDQALSKLAYQLIYPGVLGSMIFDLADPFRGVSMIWGCSLLIALCFVVDYLHLTLNLCPDGRATHWLQPIGDIVIALLFCLSYFAIARTAVSDFPADQILLSAQVCLALLLSAHVLIVVYDFFMQKLRGLLDFAPMIASAGGLSVLVLHPEAYGVYLVTGASLAAVLASYILRIVSNDIRAEDPECSPL